jgi:RNA polymerase sigma-70 factor (ECF subfamily)
MASQHQPRIRGEPANDDGTPWLEAFHRGERAVLEECYRAHFETVARAVGSVLRDVDRETVVHEVFSRLLGQADLRLAFHGGGLGAWLATVARNQAIDYRRRLARETHLPSAGQEPQAADWEEAAEARLVIERFRVTLALPEWRAVFDVRFVQQLGQREAAASLGISRTTLAYRELRIRHELRRFVLGGDDS